MKKLIFLLSLFSSVAYGATSGSVILTGVVPAVTAIVVVPVSGYNNLDLTTTKIDLIVANVLEVNNTVNGYTVNVSSANAGKLTNGANEIPYTAKYNGTSFVLQTVPVTITTQGSQTTVVAALKSVAISYTGAPSENRMQGPYSDTLTFTIQAN